MVEQADGYVAAFYEIAKLLDIPAQPLSPKVVWETQMRPRVLALLLFENAAAPRLIERKLDDECGCPEETWEAYGAHLFMHLRAGGQSDAHADYGDDGEVEMTIKVATHDLARAAIFAWARALAHPLSAMIPDSTKTGGQG